MKKLIVFVLVSVIISPCLSQSKETPLTIKVFEQAINAPGVQVLDVRTAAEYNSGHLEKSLQADWYNKQISSSKTVLVDFGAAWCPPCKEMEPVIIQLKNDAADRYSVVNIDAATQTAILEQMKIIALPVFIVYKNGKEVWRKQGISTLEELNSKLF